MEGVDRTGSSIDGVRLADGRRIATELVVNAAGTRAGEVAAMAGLELPVHPRKRCMYHFDCRQRIGPTPLTIGPSGSLICTLSVGGKNSGGLVFSVTP